MKKRLFIFSALISLSLYANAEPSSEQKHQWDVEAYSRDAADYSIKLRAHENAIAALSIEDREVALLSASGFLNAKLSKWGEQEISAGKLTRPQLAYVGFLAVTRLGVLAQTAKLSSASVCHLREAAELRKAAEGKSFASANCRQGIYNSDIEARGIREAFRPNGITITNLTNKWATDAAMYSVSMARIDSFGTEHRHTIAVKPDTTRASTVPLMTSFDMGTETDKIAICAPILRKLSGMYEFGLENRVRKGEKPSEREFRFLFQIDSRASAFEQTAQVSNPSGLKEAWERSATDNSWKAPAAREIFTEKCFAFASAVRKAGKFDETKLIVSDGIVNERIRLMMSSSSK